MIYKIYGRGTFDRRALLVSFGLASMSLVPLCVQLLNSQLGYSGFTLNGLYSSFSYNNGIVAPVSFCIDASALHLLFLVIRKRLRQAALRPSALVIAWMEVLAIVVVWYKLAAYIHDFRFNFIYYFWFNPEAMLEPEEFREWEQLIGSSFLPIAAFVVFLLIASISVWIVYGIHQIDRTVSFVQRHMRKGADKPIKAAGYVAAVMAFVVGCAGLLVQKVSLLKYF